MHNVAPVQQLKPSDLEHTARHWLLLQFAGCLESLSERAILGVSVGSHATRS